METGLGTTLISFAHELSFFLSFLSVHTVDGHQMYFGGSVIDKASTIVQRSRPLLP